MTNRPPYIYKNLRDCTKLEIIARNPAEAWEKPAAAVNGETDNWRRIPDWIADRIRAAHAVRPAG